MVPWAATGFSLLWGAVFGLALSRDDLTLATFSGLGMGLTLVLTMLMYRQQSQLRDLAETDTLTELTNHRGFQEVAPERAGEGCAGARARRSRHPRPR